MELPRHIFAHHYNWAYPGEQPEGIRRRIRQGIGGPNWLETGAEVHGHLHLPSDHKTQIGDMVVMEFKGQKWGVKLDHPPLCTCREGMITQDDPQVTGHEIQGVCIKKVG